MTIVVADPSPDLLRRCRRFTLGDAMILLAAVAIGLAMSRGVIEFVQKDLARVPVPSLRTFADWKTFLFGKNRLAVHVAFFASSIFLGYFIPWLILAVVIVRLRKPRPPLREFWRQPGFVACVSPVLLFVLAFALSGVMTLPVVIGEAIVISAAPMSWLVLIATRTWYAEPGWIDRLGRVVGVLCWVSIAGALIFNRLIL